ncbi:MAG TPA: hypothetical protein VMI72_15650 [Roseiarcus sp.]|nr:hypothetical protein [Roseiarcus sp.]
MIAKREEIDRQLAELFAGMPPAKKTARCKACGELGHIAKTCPSKRTAEATPDNSLS